FARTLTGATLLRNDANRGKGFSVARGMAAAQGARRVFTDADLAYPVEEIDHMVRELDGGADVAIACRVLPESRYLMSPSFFHYLYTRHLMSRLFNRVVRVALLPGILDTQAGLKAFTARAAQLIFPRLTVAGVGGRDGGVASHGVAGRRAAPEPHGGRAAERWRKPGPPSHWSVSRPRRPRDACARRSHRLRARGGGVRRAARPVAVGRRTRH